MMNPFAEVVAVINNCVDMGDAIERARWMVEAGEITHFLVVTDEIDRALRITKLKRRQLEPLLHYSDHFLAKVTQPGCEFLCHWDSDAKLEHSCDWVTPSANLLQKSPRILVGAPAWPHARSIEAERLQRKGPFDLSFGFSDQAFLVRRSMMARPIYRKVCPATWWQPSSHLAPIFEQRVDAYMRRSMLLRAVFTPAVQYHDAPMAQQPAGTTSQALRRRAQHEAFKQFNAPDRAFHPTFVQQPGRRKWAKGVTMLMDSLE